jgi:hypothetical protein
MGLSVRVMAEVLAGTCRCEHRDIRQQAVTLQN